MQTSEVREKISNIEQCVDKAARACQQSSAVPDPLRKCLNELESESDQARQLIQNTDSADQIRQCIDRLEQLGDRAVQECQRSSTVDRPLQNAVQQAHDAISDLKRVLH